MNRSIFGAAVLALLMVGCHSASKPAPAAAHQRYSMRGILVRVPAAGEAKQDLLIHHEAVPGFVDEFGKTVGMMAMTMPFKPAPGVDLQGLKAGEKVAFTLDVDWADVSIVISKIAKLPDATALELGAPVTDAGPAR